VPHCEPLSRAVAGKAPAEPLDIACLKEILMHCHDRRDGWAGVTLGTALLSLSAL
jgi:hypothetical protein